MHVHIDKQIQDLAASPHDDIAPLTKTMTLDEIQDYLKKLPNVSTTENFGYRFFCYATDQVRPFVSLIESDNDYDRISDLNRAGVFRLNIGVSQNTFKALFPGDEQKWDYTELNKFMPHHEYASHHFICVLNPTGNILAQTLQFIDEAHALAKSRFDRKQNG